VHKLITKLFYIMISVSVSACLNIDLPSNDNTQPPTQGGNSPVTEPSHYPSLFSGDMTLSTGGAANMAVRHTCGVTHDRHVLCWGSNVNGQLGNDTFDDSSEPVMVVGGDQGGDYLSDIVMLTLGHSHACAVDSADAVYCWGGADGTLGQGVDVGSSSMPLRVISGQQSSGSGYLEKISQIGAGFGYTCVLTHDQSVLCWGTGNNGRLGNGGTSSTNSPEFVLKGEQDITGDYLGEIRSLSVGFRGSCAITEGDVPFCWGDGRGTGIGVTSTQSSPVQPLSGQQGLGTHLIQIEQIAAGWNKSCAVTTEGAVYCWGADSDDFGHDGAPAGTPVRVLAGDQSEGNDGVYLGNVQRVEGNGSYCAITNDDDFFCWGTNLPNQPARMASSHFKSGYVEKVKHMTLSIGTLWITDELNRPIGWGFNYHSTFIGEDDTFFTEPYFLDLTQ
jgi:alpha-tubulin suppressor-like RCC1 family protein